MFKFLLFFAGLIALGYAADSKHVPLAIPAVLQGINSNDLFIPIKTNANLDMIPKETQNDLDLLTPEQHVQLEEAFRKYGANAKSISADLEAKHPDLAKKVANTMGKFEEKLEKLTPDGRTFIGSVIKELQKLKTEKDLKAVAKQLISSWNDLGDEAKESVKEQFPSIPKVLSSEKFEAIANMKTED